MKTSSLAAVEASVTENQDPSQQEKAFERLKVFVKALVKYNASDLHLKSNRPPIFRINGNVVPAKMEPLSEEDVKRLTMDLMSPLHRELLRKNLQVDFSLGLEGYGRFRFNVFYQRGTLAAVIRMLPVVVPGIDTLGVPSAIKEIAHKSNGLIIVSGPTGSGKSTSLAAIIQHINETRSVHVVTIEDPIEFVYTDIKASITQRELGHDTHSFSEALMGALRQDPDVIIVGEMREPKTVRMALMAAETGHLVLTTVHSSGAQGTIERILEVFPEEERNHIRVDLASSLLAILSQQLLMQSKGAGRILVSELLIKSPAVGDVILRNELGELQRLMQESNSFYKMHTFNQELEKLIQAKRITLEEGLSISSHPEDLKVRLSGIRHEEGFN